jgi:hypothetical protein
MKSTGWRAPCEQHLAIRKRGRKIFTGPDDDWLDDPTVAQLGTPSTYILPRYGPAKKYGAHSPAKMIGG